LSLSLPRAVAPGETMRVAFVQKQRHKWFDRAPVTYWHAAVALRTAGADADADGDARLAAEVATTGEDRRTLGAVRYANVVVQR
jgi:hypothetical protein